MVSSFLTRRRRRVGRGAAGAFAISALVLASACGSADAPKTAGPAASAPTDSALAAVLQNGYQGHFQPVPTSGPKAVPGKSVWNISCGQAYATCSYISQQFEAAGQALGWKVTTQDSKGDPTTTVNLIKQAVAAKVDGVSIMSRDCPVIKSGLEAAKAAHLPVVNLAGADCDNKRFGDGGAPLFTATVTMMGAKLPDDYYAAWNVARADYLAAKLGPAGGKVLAIRETSSSGLKAQDAAFQNELRAKCSACQIVNVDYNFTQIPDTATQIWKSALLANQDAKAVEMSVDSLMGLGLQTAIRQAKIKNLLVVGGEGGKLNYDLIRQGVQTASVPIPYGWFAWGLADTMNRIFSGVDPASLPDEGGGWQFVDKAHNLPTEGAQYDVPVDFRTAYKKIWAGQ